MKSNSRHAMLSIAVLLVVIILASCAATKPERLTRAVVTGEANAQTQPDTAVLVISVVTQDTQALKAQQQNARKSDAVINAVKANAGANPQIKTSDYTLQPQQSYRSNKLPTIIGYEASNTVTVMMSDLDKVGAVIDAASQAGANSIERVSFILREDNPARSQTLADATHQAMTKAQAMAKALNGRVVRVVEEQEGGAARPLLRDYEANANASTMNSNMSVETKQSYRTPFEAGSLNVKSQVQIVVEIEAQP